MYFCDLDSVAAVTLTFDLDLEIKYEKIGIVKVSQYVEYGRCSRRGKEIVVKKPLKKGCWQTHKQTDKQTNKMSFIERVNGESDLSNENGQDMIA